MNEKIMNKNCEYDYYLDCWLNSKAHTVKASTYIRYRNIVENHIKPELGKCSVDNITACVIEEFILKKQFSDNRLSAKTISDIVTVIKSSVKYAQSCGANVASDFNRIYVKKERREMRVLSVEEEKRLLSVLLNNTDRYKLGVFICLYTGIRIGELCALKWKNISLADKIIRIEYTMQRLQTIDSVSDKKTEITITKPKSYSSSRTIPLPEFVAEIIRPFSENADCYLLSADSEIFVEPRTMQNRFKKYLADGKIEDANFHCLRHTFATRCVEAEFDIKSLSEILGHSSVNITLDKYVHSSIQQKRKNMEKLSLSFKKILTSAL